MSSSFKSYTHLLTSSPASPTQKLPHIIMSSNRLGKLIASKWRGLASSSSSSKEGRRRRRKGHFVVYATGGKRFVVPLSYLDHPIFRVLLELAEEEFGTGAIGALRVPCEEELMNHLVQLMGKTRHYN